MLPLAKFADMLFLKWSLHPQNPQTISVEAVKRQSSHLDADLPEWLPSALGTSAGKGSPSAQTAPSSKYSFFQMGTVRLSVSMSQRQASKAAARCAEATTIKTLGPPTS